MQIMAIMLIYGMKQQKKGSPQRLKRTDLVMGTLYLFNELYESREAESIWDISIPIDDLRDHLKERFGVEYTSSQWIFTQLRRYEDELGAPLFVRNSVKNSKNFHLALYPNMIEFVQKQHLYVPQKIKVANGVFDKIQSTTVGFKEVKLCLGAGSTMFHLAQIFIQHQQELTAPCRLYTHNAGLLPMLCDQSVDNRHLPIVVAGGEIDSVTRTILGDSIHFFPTREFDFLIQGTSVVHDGKLYIESEEEIVRKADLLHNHSGTKMLVLTKHECQDEPISGIQPYGELRDYDYVVVPRSVGHQNLKRYDYRFQQYHDLFEPEIMNWNYSILKVKK
jgi:hypothetical protein